MKKLILPFALFAMLSGCVATNPTNLNEAVSVKPLVQAEKTTENTVKITVVRDYGSLMGAFNTYYVKDNGKEVARLEPKEATTFYTAPGKHRIACDWFSGIGYEHFSNFQPNEEAIYHCGVLNPYTGYIKRVE